MVMIGGSLRLVALIWISLCPMGLAAVVPDVRCAAEPGQGYALFVPSNYNAERSWPLLLLFDPRARGVQGVERFAAAAEKYGWIVAGSNNSRNGDWAGSLAALSAMSQDVLGRYRINEKRLYTGGMSGGARVATQVALGTGKVAGVIAASAGFPDGQGREKVPFVVFGTAGNLDFNWLEMQDLDQHLKTPHRVKIFDGGHVWMPEGLAQEGLEFFELVAMRTGLRSVDRELVEQLYAGRVGAAGAAIGFDAYLLWGAIAEDFAGLHAGALEAERMRVQLAKEKVVKEGLKQRREEMERELEWRRELMQFEVGLKDPGQRVASLDALQRKLAMLGRMVKNDKNALDQRVALRVSRGLLSSTVDAEYRKMLEEAGLGRR